MSGSTQAAMASAAVRLIPGSAPPPYPVPLRCGVPLPKGKLTGSESAWLIGPQGNVLPAQTEVLSRWPDGSARWMLIDVMLSALSGGHKAPECGGNGESAPSQGADAPRSEEVSSWAMWDSSPKVEDVSSFVECRTTDHHIIGDTGTMNCVWDVSTGGCQVTLAGHRAAWSWALPSVIDSSGIERFPTVADCRWERSGAIRSTLTIDAVYPQLNGLRLTVRQSIFAGSGLMQTEITWHNPHRARHRGGLWDLGDPGSILFRDGSWMIRNESESAGVQARLDLDSAWLDSTTAFGIHQESSGGEEWNSPNHVDRTGRVPLRFRGYKASSASAEHMGLRATPVMQIDAAGSCLAATLPHFWQQFPKAIAADGHGIRFGFFPERENQLYELQGGERKTHTAWLKFDPAGTSLEQADLSWVHDPPRLLPVIEDDAVVPGWPRLGQLDPLPISRLDALCEEILDGPASVFVRREEIDEYGWRNFGDFFADHETVYYKGEPPLISHFNNQYDLLGGLLLQGLRTADRRWFELADALARHVTDIDLYHTEEDRAGYNGGLFWLTDHYRSCATATHRCFSRQNQPPGRPYGGGPGCEHNYATGLLAYYWLTGAPAARDAVVQLAEWVIAMEDGRSTIFSLIDDGPTGFATATSEPNYHGPGRGAGNSINTLLDGWLLTGERRYLGHAEQFLRRCVHPNDDIAVRNLLNFELRWSYTVFFMAVFKYLACKEEAAEFDAEFEYARQSLLHYARWMVEHERPYFDRPEQMEFPTETWGAQELRKANVFRWAARYADEPLRGQLRRKGDEFAERAWHDLCRFPTRTFIRPFTLAAIQGLWDAALRGDDSICEGRGTTPGDWGRPAPFEPQASRVRGMLKSPGGIGSAMIHAANPRRWMAFVNALRRR